MTSRIVLFAIAVIMMTRLAAFAQNMNAGLVGGIDIAGCHSTGEPDNFDEVMTNKLRLSFNFNAFIAFKLSREWWIFAEPGFMQKGFTRNYAIIDSTYNFQLNYLQLPILAEYNAIDSFFVAFGPEFSYLANANTKADGTMVEVTHRYTNRFDLSGVIGIHYRVASWFDVGIRYSHGFIATAENILTDEQGNETATVKEYNQYMQFVVRFKR